MLVLHGTDFVFYCNGLYVVLEEWFRKIVFCALGKQYQYSIYSKTSFVCALYYVDVACIILRNIFCHGSFFSRSILRTSRISSTLPLGTSNLTRCCRRRSFPHYTYVYNNRRPVCHLVTRFQSIHASSNIRLYLYTHAQPTQTNIIPLKSYWKLPIRRAYVRPFYTHTYILHWTTKLHIYHSACVSIEMKKTLF